MTYKDYGNEHKTYVVHRTTGCGEQGGEYNVHEILFSDDDILEALARGKELFPADPSGWTYDNFTININTSTKQGQVELEKFHQRIDEIEAKVKASPENYTTYTGINGHTITIEKHPLFDKD